MREETSTPTVTVGWEEIWATEPGLEVVREVRGLDTPVTTREVITTRPVIVVVVVLELVVVLVELEVVEVVVT